MFTGAFPVTASEPHTIPGHPFLNESGLLSPGQLWLALHELNWELECHTNAPCVPTPTVTLISLGRKGQTVLPKE